MMPKAEFSHHALERVKERLHLRMSEVRAILDGNKAVDIGKENHTNRVHRLFYSEADDMCFVAVQDEKNGEVVTILPIDYHNRKAWTVSFELQDQARVLICGEDDFAFLRLQNAARPIRSSIRVNAVLSHPNGSSDIRRLGTFEGAHPFANLKEIADNDEFKSFVKEGLKRLKRKIASDGKVNLMIRRFKKDPFTNICVDLGDENHAD